MIPLYHKIKKRFLFVPLVMAILLLASNRPVDFQSGSIDPTELEVLSDIVLADSLPTVYYKTIISELSQPLSRHLFYFKGFHLCSSLVNSDSMVLGKEEKNYIVERFSTMESVNINKLVKEPKKHTLKNLDGHNWSVISLPVVFRDGQYAIYYSKGAYSGQFILMKNIDGGWKDVCYSSVWNE